jgi:hypothetical protein
MVFGSMGAGACLFRDNGLCGHSRQLAGRNGQTAKKLHAVKMPEGIA